tara:strand:+ start:2657 stop:2809 length:153 start_codon:yes stop_codon:yes gene_type:complete
LGVEKKQEIISPFNMPYQQELKLEWEDFQADRSVKLEKVHLQKRGIEKNT